MIRGPLRYHQPFALPARIILGLGALVPLWGAYDLLVQPGASLLQWGMAPFIAMGLIALVFGLSFLMAAMFGGARTVTFDRTTRAMYVDFEGTFGMRRRFSHPFSTLGEVRVVERTSTDGPSSWAVEFSGTRKPLLVEVYPDEVRAKSEATAIVAYLAGR